ncbi:MAG: glutaminyl-peptide cyclotransferase [Thermodesulfobacteriota bacterium]
MKIRLLLLTLAICVLVFCGKDTYAQESGAAPVYGYKVVNTYPHNTDSFTQGLVIDNGVLYESTGLNGKSGIQVVDIETGEILRSHKISDRYFGEGIAIVDNHIIQLTWRAKKGFVYDKETFDPIKTFTYKTQGWGITYDGTHLIMSDGSDKLYFMNPKTYKVVGELQVYDQRGKVGRLNELEFIDGQIYANIWGTEKIAIINPKTGIVNSWIDLSGILNKADIKTRIDVLNGIAYDKEQNRLFITGKLWPKLYEIQIVKPN